MCEVMSEPRSPKSPQGPPLSIGDYLEEDVLPSEPNTPRSVRACDRQGVEPSELVKRDEDFYKEPGDSEHVLKKRQQHHERIRLRKLEDVRAEYQLVLEEDRVKGGDGDVAAQLEAAKQKRIEDVEERRMNAKKEKQRKEIQNMIFQQKRAVEIEAQIKKQEEDEAARKAKQEEGFRRRRIAQEK